ncbi:hypothetical protein C7E18_14905, partial [Stenotrophomonas maltophilia]
MAAVLPPPEHGPGYSPVHPRGTAATGKVAAPSVLFRRETCHVHHSGRRAGGAGPGPRCPGRCRLDAPFRRLPALAGLAGR